MGKLTAFALAALVAFQRPATPQFTEADVALAQIEMSRENKCSASHPDRTDIGQCPVYTVRISGDGTVTYHGTAHWPRFDLLRGST